MCTPGAVAPADGATIPANTPALAVLLSRSHGLSADTVESFDELKLMDALGREVPVMREAATSAAAESLLRPTTALAPGTYRIVRKPLCALSPQFGLGAPTNGALVEQRFTVTPARPLPTTAGSISVGPASRGPLLAPAGDCRGVDVDAALVKLQLHPSPELAPFLAVARLTVDVAGQRWAQTLPGGEMGPIPPSFYAPGRSAMTLFRACTRTDAAHDLGVDREHVTGTVTVDIPGIGALPPLPFSATLSCERSSSVVDGGGHEAGADLGGADAGADRGDGGVQRSDGGNIGGSRQPDERVNWGCSAAGPTATPPLGAAAISGAALAALALRRSRRRQERTRRPASDRA